MSHPTATTADPRHSRVHSYVAQVRAELGDLPPEEVEDLTLGMEADLSELQDESGLDVRTRLGTPQAYAAELRAAAGLPPRAVPSRRGFAVVRSARQGAETRSARVLAAAPWLRELRSGWWVLRGLILGAGLGAYLSWSVGLRRFGLIAAVGASIWLGLRSRGGRCWWATALLNTVLVVSLPFWLASTVGRQQAEPITVSSVEYQVPETGVYNSGQRVANLYAYDAEGRRLDRVRLFDQDGRPLAITGEDIQQVDEVTERFDIGDASLWQANGEARRVDDFPAAWFGLSPWDSLTSWTPPLMILPVSPQPASPRTAPSAGPGNDPSASTSTPESGGPGSASASATPSGTATSASASPTSPSASRTSDSASRTSAASSTR